MSIIKIIIKMKMKKMTAQTTEDYIEGRTVNYFSPLKVHDIHSIEGEISEAVPA